MTPTEELKLIAKTLADWSEGKSFTFYVFGSRVRNDHKPDSDVDVLAVWSDSPDDASVDWWTSQNDEQFATVNSRLPGPIHVQYSDDPLHSNIVRAGENPVFRDRNVVCVWLQKKP